MKESNGDVVKQYTNTVEVRLRDFDYGLRQVNAHGEPVSEDFAKVSRALALREIYVAKKHLEEAGGSLDGELKQKVESIFDNHLGEAKEYFKSISKEYAVHGW